MTPEARVAAAIGILDSILDGAAAERTLTNWGRQNRYAGSSDRAAIRDLVFDALRHRRSYAWRGGAETGRGLMLGRLHAHGVDHAEIFTGQGYGPPILADFEVTETPLDGAPKPVQLDCPDWLWPMVLDSLGDDAESVLQCLQSRAPVFLRSNRSWGSRNAAIAALADEDIGAHPVDLSPTAIQVISNPRRVQNSETLKNGAVELQDVASQAVADIFATAVGEGMVLDYCAGGGGKSLALAARETLQVTAHDADCSRMKDLPARAKRAGVKIAVSQTPTGPYSGVLCDAPCSGSGAWRRQPDAKWTLTQKTLDQLIQTQDTILDQASCLVAPKGVLGYATCSLLDCENAERAAAFLARNPEWSQVLQRRFTPLDGGDGFFIALFSRS